MFWLTFFCTGNSVFVSSPAWQVIALHGDARVCVWGGGGGVLLNCMSCSNEKSCI